jgi:hypothetical protein
LALSSAQAKPGISTVNAEMPILSNNVLIMLPPNEPVLTDSVVF